MTQSKAVSLFTWLRNLTLIGVIIAILQLALGATAYFVHGKVWGSAHGGLGYLNTVVLAAAAVLAWLWTSTQPSRGVFWHAVSLPVLGLIQIALADTHLWWLHIILGLAFVLAVIGLWSILVKKGRKAEAPRD